MCTFKGTIDDHKKVTSSSARDLIDAFLQNMNENDSNSSFSREQLLSLCLDLFMAGSETTSNTLGFAMLYMVKYPEVQKRVQKEIDNVIGHDRWPSLQDRTRYNQNIFLYKCEFGSNSKFQTIFRTTQNYVYVYRSS